LRDIWVIEAGKNLLFVAKPGHDLRRVHSRTHEFERYFQFEGVLDQFSEPLCGYLWLAAVLSRPSLRPQNAAAEFSGAFNFGPALESNRTVQQLIEEVLRHWPGSWLDRHEPGAPHEAELLNLATDKADNLLGWRSVWSFEQAVAQTVEWYRVIAAGSDPVQFTREQIQAYSQRAGALGIAWASDGS
jgi:CDP-glucose 4,6-dehydratase